MADVPSLNRRTLLRGAAVSAVALPLGTAALTSCSSEPSPEEVTAGKLVELANAAIASAAAARGLKAVEPGRAAALDEIAGIRDTHAARLRDEINRLHSSSAALITTPSAAPASSPDSPAPAKTGLEAFRGTLTADADAARRVAVAASGFQAGLTASVSASITSLTDLLS